jgi:hypothetical protein
LVLASFGLASRIPFVEKWPEDGNSQLTFSKTGFTKISSRHELNERDTIRGFDEYLTENMVPKNLLHLKHNFQYYSYFFM